MAPLLELPNSAGLRGLYGRAHGGPGFVASLFLFKHEIETHRGADNRSNAASDSKAVSVAVLSATENAAETLMVDTINKETMLIEEGTPVPESLQFESEPWAFFYRAGGIIRELRKASGKQSKYGSEGNMAHSDKVIDRYDHPRNVGSLPKDDPNVGIGLVGAPTSGDVIELQMRINSETQVIEEAEFKTFGCGSATASSSLPTQRVKGKTSRKHWPSRMRIWSASSAFPWHRAGLHPTRYSRIWGRLHLVGSPIF